MTRPADANAPAGCGAPSIWSRDGRATVLSCIGCGRIDTARQCAGTCGEYRLDIVPAATHDRAVARLASDRRRLDTLRAVTARLAADGPADDDWQVAYRALQAHARAALRSLPAGDDGLGGDEAPERLEVWSCGCCGRVEAEAPCIGVCTDVRLEVVRADVHDDVQGRAAAVRAQLRDVSSLVRQVAFATPRPGGWEASFRALRDRARDLAAAGS